MRRRIDNYQRAWLELMFAGIGVMSLRLANVVVVWREISHVKADAGTHTVDK